MNLSAFSVELKVGTSVGDYKLPVVTGGAEPQEGGEIAQAWIIDLKVYPMTVSVPKGTSGRAVKIFDFVYW